jgi:hypothetical protein
MFHPATTPPTTQACERGRGQSPDLIRGHTNSGDACAQGKDLWTLITNDIDHEKIHTSQVPECVHSDE